METWKTKKIGRRGDRKVATKVANDPQLSLTFLTNHLRSLFGPRTQQDYSWPSTPWNSDSNHQHHYTIGIFSIAPDLHHTSVIGYRYYQSSDFDIGDYSSLFYFYLFDSHAHHSLLFFLISLISSSSRPSHDPYDIIDRTFYLVPQSPELSKIRYR